MPALNTSPPSSPTYSSATRAPSSHALPPKIPCGVGGSRRRHCGWRSPVSVVVRGGPLPPSPEHLQHLDTPAELRIELRREIRPQHVPAAGHGIPAGPLDGSCARCTRCRRGGLRCSGMSIRGGDLSDVCPFILACRKWGRKRSRAASGHGAQWRSPLLHFLLGTV
jgi:hypothetical protein